MDSAGAFSMVTCSPRAKIGIAAPARGHADQFDHIPQQPLVSPAPSAATRMQAEPWWVEATMRPSAELAVERMLKPSCSSSWAMPLHAFAGNGVGLDVAMDDEDGKFEVFIHC